MNRDIHCADCRSPQERRIDRSIGSMIRIAATVLALCGLALALAHGLPALLAWMRG